MSHPLVEKYGEARLPRYTSYPTAPAFSSAIGAGTYGDWLAELDNRHSVSLYLHIPFCRSMCWYCGCHTTITKQDRPILDYLDVLRQEIALVASRAKQPLLVQNVHFGGGTPTIMRPKEFVDLMKHLRNAFKLRSGAEIAVEIDPRTLAREMVGALAEGGVCRASLGVQSFDPVVQAAINRNQTFEQTEAAVQQLRKAGIGGINFDLIYGLPHQTVASCIDTVQKAVRLRPDRFAVFGYAHIPAFKKHQRLIDEATLPNAEERNAQAEATAEALVEAGYVRVGLDHFALPEDELSMASARGDLRRNFQGYTTDTCETLIGLGASAIGKLPAGYVQNEVAPGAYAQRIASGSLATVKGYHLTGQDRFRAAIIERLMCDFAVDLNRLEASFGYEAELVLNGNDRLRALESDGVVTVRDGLITVRKDLRFMIRAVAAAFDAYIGASGRTHSKAA
ncbi:oxygen-independent coproporphyrinogen III oxidase [Rhizobium sp. SEMIA 4085]|uniref:Coproporphyrinogen-III oxidase n=1 Tax=Rhizobium gallicum bv. gallicum R602sp TaxID=1041138 RepID=A0A0B4XDR2_9HYPH|nr:MULTISPECIES: oxygen-independent coproporphyrinogen III oxidase [Rhizobium]AJD46124.1 coproporphyrinogen III oxidase 2 [Rhizobium gallicum bv. gallicum R602sp]NNH29175.1 oxygen-independent coproporphyrinogen III oxidase [Rhizobium sp. SEMIA 4085]